MTKAAICLCACVLSISPLRPAFGESRIGSDPIGFTSRVPDVVWSSGEPAPLDLRAGDLVQDAGELILEVPDRGEGVTIEALDEYGSQLFSLETRPDGRVVVGNWGSEGMQTGGGGASAPAACADDAFNPAQEAGAGTEEIKMYDTLFWKFRIDTTPSYLNQTFALDALRAGTTNVTHSINNCNLADQVGATAEYEGTTAISANIVTGGTGCLDNDGLSVVAFGAIDNITSRIATMCWWDIERTGRDEIIESDIRFDTTGHTWFAAGGPACSGDYNLEAVMTHERGHAFGLAHVNEEDHGYLTMSPNIEGPCQNSESTLGWGDVLGLRYLY